MLLINFFVSYNISGKNQRVNFMELWSLVHYT